MPDMCDRISGMVKNSPDTLAKRNERRAYWKATIDPGTVPLYVEKTCGRCKKLKLCKWSTNFTQTGAPEYRSLCDECWNERGRERAKKNRDKLTAQKLDRSLKRKEQCIEYMGGSCSECGYSKCTKALTFHHLDPLTKSFSISEKIDAPWNQVAKELDKCVLLCFNCHMEQHCVLDMELLETRGQIRRFICSHYTTKEWDNNDA